VLVCPQMDEPSTTPSSYPTVAGSVTSTFWA
jgi:hypothetical protein